MPLSLPDVQFPEKLEPLWGPKPIKVLYGGRGAGRSWGCARKIVLDCVTTPLRVLCVRELQNSISESVHKLLTDQISELGLDAHFTIEKAKIYSKAGAEISFEGIKNNTTKIKSYEGITLCWVEEANKVSKASWEILIPTLFRRPNCQLWITFNPELATDYTYRYFVRNANTKDSDVIFMTWKDNPWFPAGLANEMEKLKALDYDAYLNVWEGKCRENLEGAVFAKELRKATEQGRICTVPWEREIPVDTFWDLGRHDLTSIWFAQRVAMQYRVLAYYENSQEDIQHYLQECQNRHFTYGTMWLPHDAEHKRLGMRRSIRQLVQSAYPNTRVVPRINKKVNGINAARMIFPSCWFDEDLCEEGLDRLRHYRYKVVDGQLSEEPLHDENSNGADAFMTLAQSIRTPRAPSQTMERLAAKPDRAAALKLTSATSSLGWMAS